MNIELNEMKEAAEAMNGEKNVEIQVGSEEAAEMQMMETAAETAISEEEAAEQQEMDEGAEIVGYSSSYYEHEMERALANGNRIAYDNARNNWAKAKVREST